MKIQHKIINATTTHHAHVIVSLGRKKYTLVDTSNDSHHIELFVNNPQYYIDAIIAYLVPSLFKRTNFYLLNKCIERNEIY